MQAARVQAVVQANPGWRLALESDNQDSHGVRELRSRQPRFEPYFATSDRDGIHQDVAVTLVKDTVFRVFYLRSEGGSYLPAQEVTTIDWLKEGRIELRGDTLDVAPFRSDEIFTFVWDAKSKRLELIP